MPVQPSVTLRFTHAILQAAERRGIALPDSLRDALPEAGRAPLALQDELWECFCASADDPLIGLRLGLSLQVGHLDLVGMLLMSCETLGEAMDQLLEYYPIVSDGGDFQLEHQADDCVLIYEPLYRTRRRERVEAVMACVLNLARWITGGVFEVRRVQLTSRPAAEPAEYRSLLQAPVAFDAPANALVFAPALQATALIQANAEMRDHLKPLADQVLARLGEGGFSRQVQAVVRREPRWGKERVAEELGMSGRNLVRKLQEEGTSFKLLRSTLLQQLAEQQLAAGASVANVAEQLGFSDESAFAKAFKRWAGKTPSQYRETNSP